MAASDRTRPDETVWVAVLAHRERALRVALARCGSRDDVEDVVQEAMLRVAAMPGLDVARIGPLITVVVSNLVTDAHRRGASRASAEMRLRHASAHVPPHDDDICDAHEGRWLRSRMQVLAVQDRCALELRASGMTVGEIGEALGVTYKAAENSLGRARSGMRALWRATAALLGVLVGARRRLFAAAAIPAALAAALFGTAPGLSFAPHLRRDPQVQAQSSFQTPLRAVAAPFSVGVLQIRPERPLPSRRMNEAAAIPAAPKRQQVVPALRAGKLQYGGAHVEDRPHDESAVDTVMRCARHVTVSLTHVECDG